MSDYFSTTRAERLTIAKIVDPSIFDIDTASKMLYRLWDDNFSMREQKSISAEEADDIGNDIVLNINKIYGRGQLAKKMLKLWQKRQKFIMKFDVYKMCAQLIAITAKKPPLLQSQILLTI